MARKSDTESLGANADPGSLLVVGPDPLSIIFSKLTLGDWSRFSRTCTNLKAQAKATPQGRVIARKVIPREVLAHPIFTAYPIDWNLLDRFTRYPEKIAPYFQDSEGAVWILAALLGLKGAVHELLGSKIGTQLGYGATTVGHFYAAGGYIGLFEEWLRLNNPNFSAQQDPDLLYLQLIVTFGQVDMLAHFISNYGYDIHSVINVQGDENPGFNLCGLAAMADQVVMLKYLIAQGVNATLHCLRTEAAMSAAWTCYEYLDNEQIIQEPIEAANLQRIIISAAGSGKTSIFEALTLAYNIDPKTLEVDGLTLLRCAARNGNISMIKYCVAKGWGSLTDVDSDTGWTVLHEVVAAGHFRLLTPLLELEPALDLNVCDYDGFTLLHCAAEAGDLQALIELAPHYPELPATLSKITVAHIAAAAGHLDCLKKLVELYGEAILFAADNNKDTLQHYACRSINLSLIRWVLEKANGLNLSIKNLKNETPLFLLAQTAVYRKVPNTWYFIIELAKKYGEDILKIQCGSHALSVNSYLYDECMNKHRWLAPLLAELRNQTYENPEDLLVGITLYQYGMQ